MAKSHETKGGEHGQGKHGPAPAHLRHEPSTELKARATRPSGGTISVNYLVNGGDVFALQQILGHTTLEMVRHCVNLANAHVMTPHRRLSPVDSMNLRQIKKAVEMRNRGDGRKRAGLSGM